MSLVAAKPQDYRVLLCDHMHWTANSNQTNGKYKTRKK